MLVLDDDLLTVTRITNGDGTEITGDQYVLLPANTTPKWAVKLKASSGVSWAYVDDPEGAIEVEGTWGYAHAQPDDIRHAAIRLTAWFYHQRQAPLKPPACRKQGWSPFRRISRRISKHCWTRTSGSRWEESDVRGGTARAHRGHCGAD